MTTTIGMLNTYNDIVVIVVVVIVIVIVDVIVIGVES